VVSALIGAYFALGMERAVWRVAGLILTLALAAGVFYGAYLYLPSSCRP
jgi:hypothetical protein